MALVHLKRGKRKDGNPEVAAPVPGAQPDYSYGLVLRLENEELDKLGIKQLPAAGKEITLHAKAKVSRVSQSQSPGNKGDRNLELQITHMDIGAAGDKADVGQVTDGEKRANVGAVAQSDKKANVGRAGKTDSAFAE